MTDIVERLRQGIGATEPTDVPKAERVMDQAADEIERLRAALQRIADDDVENDLKGNASVLSGVAWAALNPETPAGRVSLNSSDQ